MPDPLTAEFPDLRLLNLDCTHAFVETTLEDELGADWIGEEVVYGLFEDFRPLLSRSHVEAALAAVHEVDEASILRICSSVPREWGMTGRLSDRMSECILARASKLKDWLPEALFEQREMDV